MDCILWGPLRKLLQSSVVLSLQGDMVIMQIKLLFQTSKITITLLVRLGNGIFFSLCFYQYNQLFILNGDQIQHCYFIVLSLFCAFIIVFCLSFLLCKILSITSDGSKDHFNWDGKDKISSVLIRRDLSLTITWSSMNWHIYRFNHSTKQHMFSHKRIIIKFWYQRLKIKVLFCFGC